ncbi:NifU family protein [Streptosporangium sp. NPDC000239]|uniref:NifU family protein n=1 Tax=unclassified Streptosporangium TaxID=2632669 RepID=UPI0033291884
MSETTGAQATGERVEELLAELAALGDPLARARAEELVRALVGLYGAGLERVMEIVTEEEAAGVLRRVTCDPLLCGLLAVHDLHPLDTGERVRLALEEVRPHLGGHSGDVELVSVEEDTGVVRLRLRGACDGCPSSRITVRHAIERAVTGAAPEVVRVEVEGMVEVAAEGAAGDGSLLQIGTRPPPGPCPVPEPGAQPGARSGAGTVAR